ncbi:WD40-repeat-containing domain protein [Fomes fomentarius]|nr:WD40-repeat-containing domain protein [Fomes fomentarius]
MSLLSTLPAHDITFPSTFPPEIEDRIIDQLHHDVRALRRCALTCRGWLPRSRYHLFVAVRVARREQLDSFFSFVTQFTHLPARVHSITISAKAGQPESLYFMETIPILLLTLFPNLKRWCFLGRSFYPDPTTGSYAYVNTNPMERDSEEEEGGQDTLARAKKNRIWVPIPAPPRHMKALACIRAYSSTIQELVLTRLYFKTSMDCARLILSFSALRTLRCNGILVKTSQMIPDAWLNRIASRIHICALSLQNMSIDVVNTILRMAQSSVQTLVIDVTNTNDATLDILSRPFDSLRSVELLIFTLYSPAILETGFCGLEFGRTIEQASTILDHISHPPEIVVSMQTPPSCDFLLIHLHNNVANAALMKVCNELESLFWDSTLRSLFPVLYAKKIIEFKSPGVDAEKTLYVHDSSVTALTGSIDGLRIASGSCDGTIIIWSLVNHDISPVLDWDAHPTTIRQLQFSPDGRRLASSCDRQIRIWDTIHATQLATLLDRHTNDTHSDLITSQLYCVESMVWSPVGTIIAYSADGLLQWWNTDTFNRASDESSLAGSIQSSDGTTPSTVVLPHGSRRLTVPGLVETTKQPAHDIVDPIGDCHYPLFNWIFSSTGGRLIATFPDRSSMISHLENIPPSCKLSLPLDQKQPGSTVNDVDHIVQTSGRRRESVIDRSTRTFVDMWDTHADTRIASLEHLGDVSTTGVVWWETSLLLAAGTWT